MRQTTQLQVLILFLICLIIGGCERDVSVSCSGDPPDIVRPGFWTPSSHCRGIEPNYDEVFDDTVLHEFRIHISTSKYNDMLADMDEKFGGTTTVLDLDELLKPIWVPVEVNYNGQKWTNVGMRWKGHSSLKAAWQNGVRKLSFLLTFDYFEDIYPNLLNQRLFGFKKLSFSNAYNDPAIIREKVANDVFRAAGVPVARCAFAPVYLDWGKGSVYLGMYTMIEDPSEQMLFDQFGDDTGNLYKPWGNAARWLNPDIIYSWQDDDWHEIDWRNDIALHFEKSTNGDQEDWSDVETVIKRLHRDRNVPEQWRAKLEEVFDVQSFIRKLAVDRVIMNWDSYGCMHHNYYIYANPKDNYRFTWIPWDLNEAMLDRDHAGCIDPGAVMLDGIVDGSDEEAEIDMDWPLIQFVLADTNYREAYKQTLREILDGPFAVETVHALIDKHHNLISPYVVGPEETEVYPYTNTTVEGFERSVSGTDRSLKPHVESRHAAVNAALGN